MNTARLAPGYAVTARIVDVHATGVPLVSWGGGPARVIASCVWQPQEIDWRACIGLRGLLVFEDGDPESPIWVAWIDEPRTLSAQPTGSSVEPRMLHFKSSEELVFECGKSKIALRKDGRISILAGYLLSRSTGVHKIKGASVEIN